MDIQAAEYFPFIFGWFVGFYTGNFNTNQKILNRNEAGKKKMIQGKPKGRRQAQKLVKALMLISRGIKIIKCHLSELTLVFVYLLFVCLVGDCYK